MKQYFSFPQAAFGGGVYWEMELFLKTQLVHFSGAHGSEVSVECFGIPKDARQSTHLARYSCIRGQLYEKTALH